MIEKELRKMSRGELLVLLLDQAEENKKLKEELDEALKKLEQKQIAIDNAGSIAEASLHLNGVFEAAQNAIQQYVDNIKYQSEHQEEICNNAINEAQQKADIIIAEANEYSDKVRKDADEYFKKQQTKKQPQNNSKKKKKKKK